MDITTFAIDLTLVTAAFLGTLFIGLPIWLKFGGHRTLFVTIPLAVAMTLGVKSELPLVTGFTPEVIGAIIFSHVAMTGVFAAYMYPSIKAKLKKQLAEQKK